MNNGCSSSIVLRANVPLGEEAEDVLSNMDNMNSFIVTFFKDVLSSQFDKKSKFIYLI